MRFVMSKFNRAPASEWTQLRADFDREGFAVLSQFFPADFCDRMRQEVDRYISPAMPRESRVTVDVLHGSGRGRRVFLRDAPKDAFESSFKINHLFTESQIVSEAVFDSRLRQALTGLLDDEPVAIN